MSSAPCAAIAGCNWSWHLSRIAEEGAGILLYEQQEGRGIGLMAKLKAYELQDQGLDTVEANEELGFAADCRDYDLAAGALKLLGVSRVRLITNNPEKVAALESAGITVTERVSAEVEAQESFERLSPNEAGEDGTHLRPFRRSESLTPIERHPLQSIAIPNAIRRGIRRGSEWLCPLVRS